MSDDPEALRKRAAHCRKLARSTHSDEMRDLLLDFAKELDSKADEAERAPK